MGIITVLTLIGIVLGAGLISFTVVMRSRLPRWSVITFIAVGALIAVSCIFILAGTAGIR